jgi:serine phosphatase RsbU (regulator of sigma subunit)
VVRRHAASGPDALLDRIMDSIRQFRGGSTADDDTTLLAMTVD